MRYLIFLVFLVTVLSMQAQRDRKLYNTPDVINFEAVDSLSIMKEKKDENKQESKEVVKEKESKTSAKEVIPNDNEAIADTHIIRKEVYKVALILPFNAGAAWGSMNKGITMIRDSSAKKATIPRESKISIDFYNGVKMAIAEASKAKVKIEFYVYDDLKNEDQTKKLLADSTMAKMDVIIGPAHTQNAILVANFCKEHHIYNFSPLSPSIYIASSNPYHFKLNPSTEMLCKSMVDNLVKQYQYGSVLVLGRATEDDRHYAAIVYDYVQEWNKKLPKDRQLFCDTLISGNESNKKSLSSFYTGNHNIVICPSFNEGFISSSCGRVSSNSNVSFYGMPTWLDYDAVNYNGMNSARPYIPKISFADTSESDDKRITKSFRENHGFAIEENTLLGYDIMNFTIYALENFGLSLNKHIEEIYYEGTFTKFKFIPVKYIKGDTTLPYDLYENNQINFPQFNNFELDNASFKD